MFKIEMRLIFTYCLVHSPPPLPPIRFVRTVVYFLFVQHSNKRLEVAGDNAVSAFGRDANNSFRRHVEVCSACVVGVLHLPCSIGIRMFPPHVRTHTPHSHMRTHAGSTVCLSCCREKERDKLATTQFFFVFWPSQGGHAAAPRS